MSIQFYKMLHFVGIFMVFSGLGAQFLHAWAGGSKQHAAKKWLAILHGVGLLLIFVAGFGLIVKVGANWPWPGWIWAKLLIWVALGGAGAVAMRKQNLAAPLWGMAIAFGTLAAYMALFKPF